MGLASEPRPLEGAYGLACVRRREEFRKNGETNRYAAEIRKIDKNNKDHKNFVLQITDEQLLEKTNGILQGMSGSPVIQNGKLVGAVTHVFVNEPTKGYGIFAENMQNAEE